jgi:hypothetical protein
MRVTARVLQNVLRPTKRLVGVDHPIGLGHGGQVFGEGLRVLQLSQRVEEMQLAVVERRITIRIDGPSLREPAPEASPLPAKSASSTNAASRAKKSSDKPA